MAEPKVQVETRDGVRILRLTEPPANTYSYEMMRELDAAILDARMDDAVHVVVLIGAGDRFFSAGADIGMLHTVTPSFKYYFCLHANETLRRLEETPKLVIAALNGHAVGGGLEIALAADLRVARERAGKIGLPEVNLGVLPGTGGTQRLARLIGPARAIELMVTGATFDVWEAQRLGIVNKVLPFDDFEKAVLDYARQFVPPDKAARSVGAIKRAVRGGLDAGLGEGLALERELQQQLFTSADGHEGIDAYVAKRKPTFVGR